MLWAFMDQGFCLVTLLVDLWGLTTIVTVTLAGLWDKKDLESPNNWISLLYLKVPATENISISQ